jgi:hypothetical protein
MSHEDILTDRLINIIQTLQLSRETGTLIAKRGDGAFSEEGRIVFTNGRITETRVGSHSGSDAFNRMSTWENCLVTFFSPGPAKPLLSASMDTPEPMNISPRITRPLPRGARPNHAGNNGWGSPPISGLLPGPETPAQQDFAMGIPFLVQPLPHILRAIEQNRLSRVHRQLVLLIDGRRSIEELARLIVRTNSDVYRLLYDLTRIGLVQISNESFR